MKISNKLNIAASSLFMSLALLTGCNEDVVKTEFDKDIPTFPVVTPPGEEYVKEGETCLNVFYLIPQELDTVPQWHRRLSGTTLNMQEYIRENFEHAGLGSKTFNLNKNKDSEHYIKIHYIFSSKVSIYASTLPMNAIMNEVKDYWAANPGTQDGNNTLVYLPLYGNTDGEVPFHGG